MRIYPKTPWLTITVQRILMQYCWSVCMESIPITSSALAAQTTICSEDDSLGPILEDGDVCFRRMHRLMLSEIAHVVHVVLKLWVEILIDFQIEIWTDVGLRSQRFNSAQSGFPGRRAKKVQKMIEKFIKAMKPWTETIYSKEKCSRRIKNN